MPDADGIGARAPCARLGCPEPLDGAFGTAPSEAIRSDTSAASTAPPPSHCLMALDVRPRCDSAIWIRTGEPRVHLGIGTCSRQPHAANQVSVVAPRTSKACAAERGQFAFAPRGSTENLATPCSNRIPHGGKGRGRTLPRDSPRRHRRQPTTAAGSRAGRSYVLGLGRKLKNDAARGRSPDRSRVCFSRATGAGERRSSRGVARPSSRP